MLQAPELLSIPSLSSSGSSPRASFSSDDTPLSPLDGPPSRASPGRPGMRKMPSWASFRRSDSGVFSDAEDEKPHRAREESAESKGSMRSSRRGLKATIKRFMSPKRDSLRLSSPARKKDTDTPLVLPSLRLSGFAPGSPEEEWFTPQLIPSAKLPSVSTLPRIPIPRAPAPTPTRDIFSPRIPSSPELRANLGSLPVSPLELPVSRTARLPTGPSLDSQLAARMRIVSPRSRQLPSLSSEVYLEPFQQSPKSHLIRPPILPTPTPPSLILSPRTLGTPHAGSGFCKPKPRPISLGRASLPGSGFGVLGLQDVPPESHIEGEKRIPTPGTFAKEVEADRLAKMGINPYFA